MKLFVLINAIIEILAGVILFFAPTIVPEYANASGDTLTFLNMYGAAALAMGLIALLIWKNYESVELQDLFVKAFSLFHALPCTLIFIFEMSGIPFCRFDDGGSSCPVLQDLIVLIRFHHFFRLAPAGRWVETTLPILRCVAGVKTL